MSSRRTIGAIEEEGMRELERLPANLADGLRAYVLCGTRPGAFLQAVVANDLYNALRRMQPLSGEMLRNVCAWLHRYAPDVCHGSSEKLESWITAGQMA